MGKPLYDRILTSVIENIYSSKELIKFSKT